MLSRMLPRLGASWHDSRALSGGRRAHRLWVVCASVKSSLPRGCSNRRGAGLRQSPLAAPGINSGSDASHGSPPWSAASSLRRNASSQACLSEPGAYSSCPQCRGASSRFFTRCASIMRSRARPTRSSPPPPAAASRGRSAQCTWLRGEHSETGVRPGD